MGVEGVIARRRAEQDALLRTAAAYVGELADRLRIRAAVVFGSVARGDFNQWSDVDVLVVAEDLPADILARLDVLGPRPAGLQPIGWTPDEWQVQRTRRNPIAIEALSSGVWLQGSPEELSSASAGRRTSGDDADPLAR